jgi:hypothetical protein
MRQYRLKASAEAERLERAAAAATERSKEANRRADNDMLGVVLFATALFFAGISGKMQTPGARRALLVMGCLVFLGGAVWIATVPVQLTT